MRLSSSYLLLAPTLTLALSDSLNDNQLITLSPQTSQPAYRQDQNLQPARPTNTNTDSYIVPSAPYTDPTPSPSNPPSLHEFELRQAVGAAGGSAPAATAATQMSPVTTYQIHGPGGSYIYIPYTQLFTAVPDPWPAPTAGTIGLGTIQGQIGVVKTKSKRSAEPTGVFERFVGGGSVRKNTDEVVKRDTSAATVGKSVPLWAGTALVGLGCLMALL